MTPPAPHTPFLRRGLGNGGRSRQNKISAHMREGGGVTADKKEKTANEEVAGIRRGKRYRTIRKCLMEQLLRQGNDKKCFEDLIEDYMNMWLAKELLNNDIQERGIRVKYDNGGGQTGWKKNESVDQMMKLNAQMLKLLAELKITVSAGSGGGEDEEL